MAQLKQLIVLYLCLSCLAWGPYLCQWHSLVTAQSFAACCKDSCSHPESYKITSVVWLCLFLLLLWSLLRSALILQPSWKHKILVLLNWAPAVFIEECTKENFVQRGNFQRSCQYYDSGSHTKKRKSYNLIRLVPVPMEVFLSCHSLFFWVIETTGFQSRGL